MKRLAAPSVLLFLTVLAVYLANGRTIGAGDTLPASYLPWSLIRHWALDLDRFPSLHDEGARAVFPLLDGIPYYLRYRNGHYRSAYSPGPAVLAAPVYAVPIALGLPPTPRSARMLEKVSAAVITALSVVFLYWTLSELVSRGSALGIALIYAFGTSSLSVSSQALWQHGPSQLALAVLLYWLVRGMRDERHLAYAGLAMSAAVVMRSTDLLLVVPLAAWIVYAHRAVVVRFLVWASVPLGALVLYNAMTFGSVDGGWGNTRVPTWALFSQVSLPEGLAGVLVSPSRGLFVYSPVFLFSIVGCVVVWRRGPWAFRMASLGLLPVAVVVGKWFLWWGGDSWGPRLLADTAPFLSFFLYPLRAVLSTRPVVKAAFAVLAAWSVGAHVLGAYAYDWRWDAQADVDRHPEHLWSWRSGPLAFYGREAVATAERLAIPAPSDQATSANAPGGLRASYVPGPIPEEAAGGEPIPVSIVVTNTGRAVWLASARGEHGSVRLGWRWLSGDREQLAGRAPVGSDIEPGESVRLTARVLAPATPGEHTLVLDMVSEGVTWFADRGSEPVRRRVRVTRPEASQLLSAPAAVDESRPGASIVASRASYRRGDPLGMQVALRYPHRPRKYDAYLLLQGPAGSEIRLFDGQRIAAPAQPPWPAWVRNLPLPAQVTGQFTLSLPDLAPGSYRWHVVLTEAGTHRVAARASAAFDVEP